MANVYATGRSRTIHLRITVSLQGTYRYNGAASQGGGLGAPGAYTTVVAGNTGGAAWDGYSEAFGVRLAVGSYLLTGDPFGPRNRALGVVVPSLSGNGFIPLALASPGASISATCIINRVVRLIEVIDHNDNGKRSDRLGEAGSCYETYTVEGITYTRYNHTSGFPPGGSLGDGLTMTPSLSTLPGFGYSAAALASTTRGALLGSSPNGGDIAATWSAAYINEDGESIWGAPTVPTTISPVGSLSWGRCAVVGVSAGLSGTHTANVTFAFFPRHAFRVRMSPLSLPSGAPLEQYHRLEVNYYNPFGGSPPAQGFDFTSAGESADLTCGGSRWSGSVGSNIPAEAGAARTVSYTDFLPLVTRIAVSHNDARPHYFCHVRGPFAALGLSQASAVSVPGGAGRAIPLGASTLAVNQRIGYRYLRIRAKTPVGVGSLGVTTHVNGALSASGALTTTSAGESITLELDLLAIPGCTHDPQLTLDSLGFVASGAAFTLDSLELFRKSESLVQSLSSRRSLFPLAMPQVLPWILCYTDGIESLRQSISGDASGNITLSSLTVRQLVQEINATTRHNYGSWSTAFPFSQVFLGSSGPSLPLLGWSATLASSPRGDKGYGTDETYTAADWSDGDVYVPALQGDGIIVGDGAVVGENGGLLLTGNGSIQGQRIALAIEPGLLPGNPGWDGSNGSAFGGSSADLITPLHFVGLFRGLAQGMVIGEPRALPISETAALLPGGGTSPISPPASVGSFTPRASGFALSGPLRGSRGNGLIENTISNEGGTDASETSSPYIRDRTYHRFWTVGVADYGALEHVPARGWLHIADGLRVVTFWRESATQPGSPQGPREAFHSPELELESIKALVAITGGRLAILGPWDGGYRLLLSGDGAKTTTEVLAMENAASALVCYDSVRNWLIVWWEDSGTHQVQRRVSRTGGASWEAAEDCQWTPTGGSLGLLAGQLRDVKMVRELAGRLVMTLQPQGTSNGVVLQSGDGGKVWTQVL